MRVPDRTKSCRAYTPLKGTAPWLPKGFKPLRRET
jgi:hypothetical protein